MRVLSRLYNPIVKYSEILWNINVNHTKTQVRKVSSTHQLCETNNNEWGSKKAHRKVKLRLIEYQKMADPKIEEILAPLRQTVKEQVSWNFFNLIFDWMMQAETKLCNFHCLVHLRKMDN